VKLQGVGFVLISADLIHTKGDIHWINI